jgi:L-lactate dehydrogenase complex protein LldG
MTAQLPSAARDEILTRIRTANAASAMPASAMPASAMPASAMPASAMPASATSGSRMDGVDAAYATLPRDYLRAHHDPAEHDIVALFAERAADYRAVVERVPEAGIPAAVAQALAGRPAPRFVVPAGLDRTWLADLPADYELLADEPRLSPAELDRTAGVITGCAVAIAETGTIILDHGPGQGRRALTLVPDFHLVIVRAAQVAADLPDAFARLDPAHPHTLISGPSATSDIELIRVEGVHGPRTLHILLTP